MDRSEPICVGVQSLAIKNLEGSLGFYFLFFRLDLFANHLDFLKPESSSYLLFFPNMTWLLITLSTAGLGFSSTKIEPRGLLELY